MNPAANPSSRFLRDWTIFVALGLGAAAAFNWFMDPYWIYNSPAIPGVNAIKTEFAPRVRMAKAHVIQKLKPKAIILGTSRAEVGLSPDHPGWDPQAVPRYNLGLSGANIYEARRYFQHAHAIQPLKQVVLAMDFFMFNVDYKNQADFDETRLAVTPDGQPTPNAGGEFARTLLSLDALNSSLRMLRSQKREYAELYKTNGCRDWDHRDPFVVKRGGHRQVFIRSEQEYAKKLWFPAPTYQYRFTNPETGVSSFDSYRVIVRTAYRDRIDLRMAILPAHAHLNEALRESGLWTMFEDWKRELVKINEEEAARAKAKPFPLWDFNNFSNWTLEAVPPAGDISTRMYWFWEAPHFKRELGDQVLDVVLSPPKIFGNYFFLIHVPITSGNIEPQLERIRVLEQLYRETHPDDMKQIKQVTDEAASLRQQWKAHSLK